MPLYVHKYGGTSVGSIERIRHISAQIKVAKEAGDNIIVVVSAMVGETNRLVSLCNSFELNDDLAMREQDAVLASGEQAAAGLTTLALAEIGVRARSFTGLQAGIITDSTHGKARIVDIDTSPLRTALGAGDVPVVAGFQGATASGSIATLGRGGSDTTAVALAAAMAADECRIFTDVDGIYTTDPRICDKARLLPSITLEEMLEMASLGSKVLQTRAVEFAGKYRVPLRVLSSMHANSCGTLVHYKENIMEQPIVTGIAFNRDEAKITLIGVPDRPGIARCILRAVADVNINVDMIVQNIGSDGYTDFSFTVHRSDYETAMRVMQHTATDISAGSVVGNANIVKVSVVGIGMKSHTGVASTMFQALAEKDINIQMISTSEVKISTVIDEQYLETAVRVLHDAFELDKGVHEDK
ncbi:aspartate kinase [Candidatus Persebacteraceae bacterium Df01]|uniref:Aspartokinase n=1 Tax=Candidatus Doriopsillibacter californiensis TaxID=2970740 RepID=A0ABT7QMZ3_9GAMM|nr:aspartate kinase [Candidatus Persebacteraceae bacterium Df01]